MTWPTVSLMMLWAAAKCFKALSKSELCNSYFSFRLSRRGLCEPGIRSCTAAFRWAATHPTGASRCCLPSSSIWRSWSHTGCPRAPKTTSAALPHPYEEKKNSSDSMVINTYVSCLISIANKHIIMHPVHLPHTQHRTWGPEISHTYTWVISLSAAGVLAQLLLFKTFTKHHLAGGNQSEQSFLQSFNWVFSSRRFRCAPVLLRTEVHSPWSKNTTGKEWHHLSCSCFEVKNRGIFTQRDSCSQRCRHITQRMLQNAEALKLLKKLRKHKPLFCF